MKLDYLLTGCVNETYIEIAGEGAVDRANGGFTLDLDVRSAPKGWDPVIIILICCDSLRLFAAKSSDPEIRDFQDRLGVLRFGGARYGGGGGQPSTKREGFIYDSAGEIVAFMKAKGFLFVEDGEVKSRTVVFEGAAHFDRFGGVNRILGPYQEQVTPLPGFGASGLSTYAIEMGDGSVLRGFTRYPYVFAEGQQLLAPITLQVDSAASVSTGRGKYRVSLGVRTVP